MNTAQDPHVVILHKSTHWLVALSAIKDAYRKAYKTHPNAREKTRDNFGKALAEFYGGKPNDADIIDEVKMELIDLE